MSSVYNTEPPTHGKLILHTSCGDLEVELWPKQAPKACRNFTQLAMEGFYDNSLFHRIIPDFIVQGGDPTTNGSGLGPSSHSIFNGDFQDEFHSRLRFTHRGLLAMANTGGPDENGTQFFFTLSRTDELNGKNTIFGKIVGDTIYNLVKMGSMETDPTTDRPLFPVTLTSISVIAPPFEDIIPRTTAEERKRLKEKQAEEQRMRELEEKKRNKGKKNVSLLSFGEAEETLPMDDATRTTKIKSSHDLLVNDPRLKKEAVVAAAAAAPPTAIHGESNGLHNKDSRASKQPPPKKSIAISRRNDDDDESNDQDGEKGFTQRQAEKKLNSIQAEIEKVQRDIKKIKKDDDDKDKNDKKSTTTKKTKTSYLDEFKSNYATRKDIKRQELRYGRTSGGGSGGASGKEEQLLQKLEAFKTKISAASSSSANRKLSSKFSAEDDNNRCIPHGKLLCQSCVRAGDADEYDNLGQEAAVDSGFLSHELVFFEKPSQRTINDYTFIDPRIEARGETTEKKIKRVYSNSK